MWGSAFLARRWALARSPAGAWREGRVAARKPGGVGFAVALLGAVTLMPWAIPLAVARDTSPAAPPAPANEPNQTNQNTPSLPAGSVPVVAASAAKDAPTDAASVGQVTAPRVGLGLGSSYRKFELTGGYQNAQAASPAPWLALAKACAAGASTGGCEAIHPQVYYWQGTYQFLDKTKLGLGYGAAEKALFRSDNADFSPEFAAPRAHLQLWTVGVYHDVNSWLKLIAEYSKEQNSFPENLTPAPGTLRARSDSDAFMIGSFFLW
jgi:hypothetical protein